MNIDQSNVFQYVLQLGNTILENQNQNIKAYSKVQKETLLNILSKNSTSEYGRLYSFSSINAQQYSNIVPLSTYRVYKPYIERMLNGDKNLLCTEKVVGWSATSATSGNVKYIPQTHLGGYYFIQDYGLRGLALANNESIRKTGSSLKEGYILVLIGNSISTTKKDKLPYASIGVTSLLQVENEFKSLSAVPFNLLFKRNELKVDIRYVYLRFALTNPNIVYAGSIYDDYILSVIQYLECNYEMLCDEIEQGIHQLSNFSIEGYEKFLQPNPQRAEELRSILSSGIQKNTLSLIWPKLQLVSAAKKVGTFLDYDGLESYLENIAYDSSPYGATESMMGVSAELNKTQIVLLPHLCYYEFIEEKDFQSKNPITLTMEQLKDGEVYELVITTQSGFYRYRIGDLLRVVGRKDGCPLFQFEGRQGIGIDLVNEKSPESALRNALIVAAVKKRISLIGSCMYGKGKRTNIRNESTLRYVVQFETKKELSETELSSFAQEIDHQISSIIKSYESARNSGLIQPLQVQQLPKGTFGKYESIARANSINPQQYKRPFIMKIEE